MRTIGIVCSALVVLFVAASAQAATTWDGGGGDGLWDTGTNWFPDGVPSGNTEIKIDNGAQIQSAGNHSVAMLRVGYGTVNGLVKVTQTAGSATFSSWITLGPTATYELQGGTLSTGELYNGFDGGDGAYPANRGTFIVSGGTLNITNNLKLASQRVGVFKIVGGAGTINIANLVTADQAAGFLTLNPNGDALSKITLSGSGQLTGISLSVAFSANPTPMHVFTVIDKAGTAGYTGTFLGLAEGAQFSVPRVGGGTPWDLTISYVGGTGNDVTLTAVPEPATLALLGLGGLGLLLNRKRK